MLISDMVLSAIRRSNGPSTASRSPQIIDGRIVDPLKLAAVLDRKFGKGAYDVEVRLDPYLSLIIIMGIGA